MKARAVFFDFDNTITTYDVLDSVIMRFAKGDRWVEFEEEWKAGRIGSRECLAGQIGCVRATKDDLDRHLERIGIDPYFKKIKSFLDSRNIKTFILSDNFEYIIKRILSNHGFSGMKVYSNALVIQKDRLIPSFPLRSRSCGRCGHCKRSSISTHVDKKKHITYYIGDGRSDICPSKHVDVVFAKAYLKDHLEENNIDHIAFENLKDVYEYFKRSF